MLLSIIIPCYNEELSLPFFYAETSKVANELAIADRNAVDVELVFIDDGSTDRTLSVIKELQKTDERIRFLSFSRCFGKEAGMYAGLCAAKGDLVVLMDADLQEPPSMLYDMISGILDEGYDCVGARRVNRKGEPPIRSFFARVFYRLINRLSKTQLVDGARDYRLMTRKMVDAILQLQEVNRFSKGLFSWVGFKTKWLEYENVKRVAGETKWSFWNLFGYSVEALISFSTAPLAFASFVGLLFCVFALALALVYWIKALLFGDPVAGFPTLICGMLLIGGLQLMCLGIVGQYLAKTYLEVKHRPIYIVREEG